MFVYVFVSRVVFVSSSMEERLCRILEVKLKINQSINDIMPSRVNWSEGSHMRFWQNPRVQGTVYVDQGINSTMIRVQHTNIAIASVQCTKYCTRAASCVSHAFHMRVTRQKFKNTLVFSARECQLRNAGVEEATLHWPGKFWTLATFLNMCERATHRHTVCSYCVKHNQHGNCCRESVACMLPREIWKIWCSEIEFEGISRI